MALAQAGAAAAALALTAEYTKTREQFGKPIATFQAVGQRAADAYVDTEAIRLTAWQAAWRIGEGLPADKEVAVAKFWAADGGQRVVHAAVHLHGGVGVDRDYPLHRFFLMTKHYRADPGRGHRPAAATRRHPGRGAGLTRPRPARRPSGPRKPPGTCRVDRAPMTCGGRPATRGTPMVMGRRPGRGPPRRGPSPSPTSSGWPGRWGRPWSGCRSGDPGRARAACPTTWPWPSPVRPSAPSWATSTSLPIDEFRSIELVLDDLCRAVLPPVVRGLDVETEDATVAGVPGVWYRPRGRPARRHHPLPPRRGLRRDVAPDVRRLHRLVCRRTGCEVFVADYRLAPEFPFPAGLEDAALVLESLLAGGDRAGAARSWPVTRAAGDWPPR